ncbi:transcription factor Pcc1-domain-containing protein [Calycina marina]|uniref:Transcription factor Pcc1-domain-containing protein n=1 Tax=Calycina marina TaxID=1763456 RepID=A0A9P7Z651_9HELO|nr:transcription factor Pcc1-domain-containing protein [Calycina marina]
MTNNNTDPNFPCSLVLDIPLPTARLASAAVGTLRVDKELSPLVVRSFTAVSDAADDTKIERILRVQYKATTNRMLRVAVNGFMESIGVVLRVMEELDVDVFGAEGTKSSA